MLRGLLAGVAVAVMLAGTAMAGPWEDGVAAYKRGDYATALRLWLPLAEGGDPRAENNLGVIYEKGLGVPQNDAEASKWYGLAAEHGHVEAKNNLRDLTAATPSANELALTGAERWVVIASRQILKEAIEIARRFSRHKSRVVLAENGWYAVILGPYRTSDIQSFRQSYDGPRLPSDTLLARGTGYVETVWPVSAGRSIKEATKQDWVDCTQLANTDLSISGCSILIEGGKEKGDDLADAYFNRGNAYYMKSKYDLAIADYEETIQIVPDFAVAYANRGVVNIYKGEYDRAIADYDKAIQLDPELAVAIYGRGIAHYYSGEYNQIFADFDRAIKLGPDDVSTPLAKLMDAVFWDDGDRAISYHDDAINLNPDRSLAHLIRGIAYLKLAYLKEGDKDTSFAIADLDKAIQLDPSLSVVYVMRGSISYDNGNTNHAMSYAQKLVTACSGGLVKLLDPVSELNPFDHFGQAIGAGDPSPFPLR